MSVVRKFKLLSSFYSERIKGTKRVRKYTPGQIVASRHDLCEKFKLKFQEVDPSTPASVPSAVVGVGPAVDAPPTVEPPPAEDTKEAKPVEPVEPEGKDVTDKYELAEKHALRVFKQEDKSYHVFDYSGEKFVQVKQVDNSDDLKDFLLNYGHKKHKK